jgi:hypothetical protein
MSSKSAVYSEYADAFSPEAQTSWLTMLVGARVRKNLCHRQENLQKTHFDPLTHQ